jgi:hypothetical protein
MKRTSIAAPVLCLGLAAPLAASPDRIEPPAGPAETPAGNGLPVAGLFGAPAMVKPGVREEAFGTSLLGGKGLNIGVLGRRSLGLYEPPSHQWSRSDIGLFTAGRIGGLHLGATLSTGVHSALSPRPAGMRSDLSAGYVARLGDQFDLRFGLGATWADDTYWDRRGPADAAAGGFHNASVGVGACYRFASEWSLGAQLGYRQRADLAAATPWDGLENGGLVTGVRLSYRLGEAAHDPGMGLFGDPCRLP